MRFYVDPDESIAGRVGGNWEYRLVKILITTMHKATDLEASTPLFVDIGTSEGGVFSFHFAARGYKVLSVEPMPQNHLYLERSIREERLFQENIRLEKIGLGSMTASCKIWGHRDNWHNGQIACDGSKPCPECVFLNDVELDTLDNFVAMGGLRNQRVGAVKVDIEAFEALLFRGGKKTLERGVFPIIIMELTSHVLLERTGVEPLDFVREIGELGFEIYEFEGNVVFPVHRRPATAQWRNFATGTHELMLFHYTSALQYHDIFTEGLKKYIMNKTA
jgi:FkbM family methyltransferase